MKKFLLCASVLSLISLFGCGDEITKTTSFDASSLSFCSAEVLKDSSGYKLVCGDEEIATIKNGEQGVNGLDGAACSAEALDDADGYVLKCGGKEVGKIQNGDAGLGCSGSSLKNGTGYVLMCAGDTVGTISNGASCTAEKVKGGYELSCGGVVVDTLRNVRDTVRVTSDTLVISNRDTVVVVEKEVIAADTLVIVTRDSIFHLDTIYKALDTLFIGVDTTNSFGLGFCSLKREGQVAQYKNDKSLRNGSFYICEAGAWREAYRYEIDLALNLPKTCKDGDAQMTLIEACHDYDEYEDEEGYFGARHICYDNDLDDEEYYVCVNGVWKNVGESEYERVKYLGTCDSKNEGTTKDLSSGDELRGYFKCYDGYWERISEVEFKKGSCTDIMNGQVYDLGSEMYMDYWMSEMAQYAMCDDGSWKSIPEQVYDFGACTAKKEGTKKMYESEEDDSNNGYYYYNGSSSNKHYYMCSNNSWNRITEAVYKLGPCTESNVGEMVEFETSVYESGSYGDVSISIHGYYNAVCEEDGVWRGFSGGISGYSCSNDGDVKKTSCYGEYCFYKCNYGYWSEISKDEYDILTEVCENGGKKETEGHYSQRYFICENRKWNEVSEAEYVLGVCDAKSDGLSVDVGESVYFFFDCEVCNSSRYAECRNGQWRALSEQLFKLGKCTEDGVVKEVEGEYYPYEYYKCSEGSWTEVSIREYEFGECTSSIEGSVRASNKNYYGDESERMSYFKCSENSWNSISEREYFLASPCESGEKKIFESGYYDGQHYENGYYICREKKWVETEKLGYDLGVCTSNNDGDAVSYCNGSSKECYENEYVYYECSENDWKQVERVIYEFGRCTADRIGEKRGYSVGEGGGAYFICQNNSWQDISYWEYMFTLDECSETNVGTQVTRLDEWNQVYYLACDKYGWALVSKFEYENPCTSANDATVVKLREATCLTHYYNDWFKYDGCDTYEYAECSDGKWNGIFKEDYELGACTSKNEGEKKRLAEYGKYLYRECSNGRWRNITYLEYSNIEQCTLDIKGKVIREEGLSESNYYKCYQYHWVSATRSEYDAWVAANP